MLNKEITNKHLLKLEELMLQIDNALNDSKIKKVEIPPIRIKENNIIKENIEKNIRLTNKKNDVNENKSNKDT